MQKLIYITARSIKELCTKQTQLSPIIGWKSAKFKAGTAAQYPEDPSSSAKEFDPFSVFPSDYTDMQ